MDDPTTCQGSIIECENQVLGERLPVAGTPFTLNYRSNRFPGRKAAYSMNIPLSGAEVPDGLKRIVLEIEVAGRRFSYEHPPAANQSQEFAWDGRDAYGRPMLGAQPARVRIGYAYEGVYYAPADFAQAFGRAPNALVTGNRARQEVTLWQERLLSPGSLSGMQRYEGDAGGWTLDVHHAYDPQGKALLLGDGGRRANAWTVGAAVVNAIPGYQQILSLPSPNGNGFSSSIVKLAPDGSVYLVDTSRHSVIRASPSGVVTVVAGKGSRTFTGLTYPTDVALAPDGSLYVASSASYQPGIYRISPAGLVTRVVAVPALSGDILLAPAPDGSLYFLVRDGNSVSKLGPDGAIATVAGNGSSGFSGDGGPATQAALSWIYGIALGPDGSLYIADAGNARVRRVGPDGIINTVAGNGGYDGVSGDGGPATSAELSFPQGLAIAPDGSLYIADIFSGRVRRVGPDGVITTVAGGGTIDISQYPIGEGDPATAVNLIYPDGVAVGPDGSLGGGLN